jgi:Zn-dependent protease with chaperone function
MWTKLQALLAVSVLAGFYVVTVAAVTGLVLLGRTLGYPWGGFVVLGALGLGATAVVAIVRVARFRPADATGIELTEQDAPHLWAEVRELAVRVNTRAPDRIRVVPEVNAAVSERAHLLGLVGGARTLTVGLPLLQIFTVSQLRAVLAHEMGHYSHSHTRLAAVAYRGRMTIASVIGHVGPESAIGRALRGYAYLYLSVESAVSRRQEVEADRAAASLAGREAMASSLAELPALSALWTLYLERYVGQSWWSEHAPDQIFGVFPELVAARTDDLNRLRSASPERKPTRWDTHPPVEKRIAYVSTLPDSPVPPDNRPATTLVPAGVAVADRLDDLVFRRDGRQLVPWHEYTVYAAEARCLARAESVLADFAEATRQPSASAVALLDAVGAPAYRLVGTESAGPLAVVVGACAVRSGVARWSHSWSDGPAVLVSNSGARFDADEIAARLADPRTAPEARAELEALGVRLDLTVTVGPQHEEPARVLGLVGNVIVAGERRDLILYNRGLVVLPGSSRSQMRTWENRLSTIAESYRLEEIASAAGNRYIPFDDVVRCVRTKGSILGQLFTLIGGLRTVSGGTAFAFELTLHDGATVWIRWGMDTEFSGDTYVVLQRCIDALAAR